MPNDMPWPGRDIYRKLADDLRSEPPRFPTLATDPLRPLYTEKLPTSPRFPSLAQAAQRRRDFWTMLIGRGSFAMMVVAAGAALWFDTGGIASGAAVVSLIAFVATCFYSGRRNRTRV